MDNADVLALDEVEDLRTRSFLQEVDLDGLSQRIVALPVNEEFYTSLAAGADGALYFVSRVQPGVANTAPGNSSQAGAKLGRFDFDKREASTVSSGVVGVEIDRAGKTLLLALANGSYAPPAANRRSHVAYRASPHTRDERPSPKVVLPPSAPT